MIWTLYVFVKPRGPLRDITEVPQGKFLRFIKNILKITSEEIIAVIAKPLKSEFSIRFLQICRYSGRIIHDLVFLCFCKTTRCSAGYHIAVIAKESEIHQKNSEDHKSGNHSSNSKTSEIGILPYISTDLFIILTYNG